MKRVLNPNGILIFTIHSLTALNTIKNSALHQQMFNLDANVLTRTIENFQDEPFVFFMYDPSTIKIAKADSEYGNTFIHPDYIHKNWAMERFKVIEVIPCGLRNWQDLVILQRSSE